VFEKAVSNVQEVAARGGRLILIGDQYAAEEAGVAIEHVLPMPDMAVNFAPIQMLAPIRPPSPWVRTPIKKTGRSTRWA
jgi:glutamine---fructose-6-phosphate transaminase (isomerizing)